MDREEESEANDDDYGDSFFFGVRDYREYDLLFWPIDGYSEYDYDDGSSDFEDELEYCYDFSRWLVSFE